MVLYQFERLWKFNEKLVVIFIKDFRFGVFFFFKDGFFLFVDSYFYGFGGVLFVCLINVNELVMYLVEIFCVILLKGFGVFLLIYF